MTYFHFGNALISCKLTGRFERYRGGEDNPAFALNNNHIAATFSSASICTQQSTVFVLITVEWYLEVSVDDVQRVEVGDRLQHVSVASAPEAVGETRPPGERAREFPCPAGALEKGARRGGEVVVEGGPGPGS